MKGSNTIAQANLVAPVLHIKLSIHVQNTIYNNFVENINVLLVTSQLKLPKQYTFLLPIFCNDAITTKKRETIK